MITQSTKTKLMAMLIGTGMVAAMWAAWGACPANAIVSTDVKSPGKRRIWCRSATTLTALLESPTVTVSPCI